VVHARVDLAHQPGGGLGVLAFPWETAPRHVLRDRAPRMPRLAVKYLS
jgi:hypothetical protein